MKLKYLPDFTSLSVCARSISAASALRPASFMGTLLFITGAYCKSLLVPSFGGDHKGQRCQGGDCSKGEANFCLLFQGVYFADFSLLFSKALSSATTKSSLLQLDENIRILLPNPLNMRTLGFSFGRADEKVERFLFSYLLATIVLCQFP